MEVELSCAIQTSASLSSRPQLPLRRTWHAPRRLKTPLSPLVPLERYFACISQRDYRVAQRDYRVLRANTRRRP